MIRLRVKGLREQQGGEGQGEGWEPHPRALLQGAEGRGPRLPGGLWPFPGGFSLEGWRWGKMTQQRLYLFFRLQPTSHGAHTQDQESPTFLRLGEHLSSLSQGGTLGGGWDGVGPCRLSTGMSGRDPCQVCCSGPGPPAWREPLERAAEGNTLDPQGREGAAGRPGEGPGKRPPQAAAPGTRRTEPEMVKQGRQSQHPAGNTCKRASPRPSLAPGSSRLQDVALRFGEDLPLEWLICNSSDSQSQRPAGNTCGRASCLAPLWPQAALSSLSQPWCARPRQSTKQEPSLPRPQHGDLGLA